MRATTRSRRGGVPAPMGTRKWWKRELGAIENMGRCSPTLTLPTAEPIQNARALRRCEYWNVPRPGFTNDMRASCPTIAAKRGLPPRFPDIYLRGYAPRPSRMTRRLPGKYRRAAADARGDQAADDRGRAIE